MRRLALVLALAIVFAPGWRPGGAGDGRNGEDLAARVLAPSFDEGVLRDHAADSKESDGRADDLAYHDLAGVDPALSRPHPDLPRVSATAASGASQATDMLHVGRH